MYRYMTLVLCFWVILISGAAKASPDYLTPEGAKAYMQEYFMQWNGRATSGGATAENVNALMKQFYTNTTEVHVPAFNLHIPGSEFPDKFVKYYLSQKGVHDLISVAVNGNEVTAVFAYYVLPQAPALKPEGVVVQKKIWQGKYMISNEQIVSMTFEPLP